MSEKEHRPPLSVGGISYARPDPRSVARLVGQIIAESGGRGWITQTFVYEVLAAYPSGSPVRRAVGKELKARRIRVVSAVGYQRMRAKVNVEQQSGMDADDAPVVEGRLELKAGFHEDALAELAARFCGDPQFETLTPFRRKRRAPVHHRGASHTLAGRAEVRRAAFKWLQEYADQRTGEVAGPLRGLAGHLMFCGLTTHPPSTLMIREILEALQEAELVGKYDEEKAVVRVLEFLNRARPRRRKSAVRGG